jgi:pyruvate formate lyase activating enzyme
MIAHLKAEGWAIKLDTNGSRPHILEGLVAQKLVDMVAMDVKAPLVQEKYDRCAGVPVDLQAVKESIRLLQRSGITHEFRMTVLPRFHSREDIEWWIAELGPDAQLTLQNFKPTTTLDPEFLRETGFHPEGFENLKKMIRT